MCYVWMLHDIIDVLSLHVTSHRIHVVHPWPKTPYRTNYPGNTELQPAGSWACRRSSTICGGWRRGSCCPRDLNIQHLCRRSYMQATDKHLYAFLRGVVLRRHLSPQVSQWSRQKNEEGVGLGVVLHWHASVVIQRASRQRRCFFMKHPFPPCQASPPVQIQLLEPHHQSFFNRQFTNDSLL